SQSTLPGRGANFGTSLGWLGGGPALRQSTGPWAEPCLPYSCCRSSSLPPFSRTGRRDFVGGNGVNGQGVVRHVLENDGHVPAAGRPAKRLRLVESGTLTRRPIEGRSSRSCQNES